MKEDKENYSPIDYRVKGDLESMKRKTKTDFNKLLVPVLAICLVISLLSLYLLNSTKTRLKESNTILENQINQSTIKIDSLNNINLLKSDSNLKNVNWQQINNISKEIGIENQKLRDNIVK